MTTPLTRVVVVGGGVTGLTAAHRLLAAAGDRVQVTLLESQPRLGGNVKTVREGGLVLDGGPDAFIIQKRAASDLCRELGLGERLIETREENRRVYVGQGKDLHLLPEGVVLTVPTRILPLARTHLFSWPGKLRMGLDLLRPPRKNGGDESIASFVRRRLGSEALERLAEPLMGGIYAGDCEKLSIQATFPQLPELEAKYGSLVRGIVATRPQPVPGAPPPSAFYALKGGMGEMIDALESSVRDRGGEIRTGFAVKTVGAATTPGARLRVIAEDRDGAALTLDADHVILTSPAHAAAGMVEEVSPAASRELRGIPYISTATMLLAFRRADVPHPMDAVGIVLPRSTGRRILAVTFVTSKWEGRAPDDTAVIRVFFGGFRREADASLTEPELTRLAREELRTLLGIAAEPTTVHLFRHDKSSAQPLVGHRERLARIRRAVADVPGLHAGGAAYDGVGLPDCVRQASEIATRVLAEIGSG
jgi:oxygen-dependent protoporphyrinogen oxidase